jgi:O-6-methylguanine DNA methyltransferase
MKLSFKPKIPLSVRFYITALPSLCVSKVDLSKGFSPWEVVSTVDIKTRNSFIETDLLPWCEAWAVGKSLPLPLLHTKPTLLLERELSKITIGKTISYKEFARRINKPQAIRYAASLLGQNPFPLIIPCHRVIKSDGKIGGYLAGTDVKELLLQFEITG